LVNAGGIAFSNALHHVSCARLRNVIGAIDTLHFTRAMGPDIIAVPADAAGVLDEGSSFTAAFQ